VLHGNSLRIAVDPNPQNKRFGHNCGLSPMSTLEKSIWTSKLILAQKRDFQELIKWALETLNWP
jgi:hypothetical protein